MPNPKFPTHEQLLKAMTQPKTLAELAARFGYKCKSSFNRQMKNGHPDLHAQALEYGKLVRAAKNAETMQKVNRARRPCKPRIARLNFDHERWVARVTAAMRHLQRQRLGPCYPWQGGYYWMGKRLDDAALIAEAERRGFV